jgi:hypothetical protein
MKPRDAITAGITHLWQNRLRAGLSTLAIFIYVLGSNITTDLFKENFLKLTVFIIFLCFSVLTSTTADAPKSRPDSHAPIGVMGDHAHKTGEVMLSYR